MIAGQINPIISSEIRRRLRKWRTYFGLVGYTGGLSLLVWGFYTIFYYINTSSSYTTPANSSIQYGPVIGKSIFAGITLLLLIIFPFIAVSLAADSIAGERERQTFDMLRITTLRDQQIVWGKLGAIFSLMVIYVLLSLPIQALAFLFGGVALAEFLVALAGILITALAFSALGIYISSIARSAKVATALSSSLIMLFTYGLPFFIWLAAIFISFSRPSFFDNPGIFETLLLLYGGGFLASINPLGAAILTSIAIAGGQGYFFYTIPVPTATGTFNLWVIPPWIVYVVFYSLLTLLLVYLTTRRISKISNFEA